MSTRDPKDWRPGRAKGPRETVLRKIRTETDLSGASAIVVSELHPAHLERAARAEEWVWQNGEGRKIETHDPADRVGGPYRLSAFIDTGFGYGFYIFAVVDSYFPLHDLVRAGSSDEAYEAYLDWAAVHRHIRIEEPDLADHDPNSLHYSPSGIPVDTDNIKGGPVRFLRAVGTFEDEE